MNEPQGNKIGFLSIILLGLNSIIGTGIFLLPGQVAALAGRWSILAYIFVTGIVLCIAWCFAKCSSLFNRNGGAYLYTKEAFGNFIGFEVGLLRWIVGIITWAALAVGFVTALGILLPIEIQKPIKKALALSIVAGLGTINIFGIKIFKRLNNIVTIAKIVPLVLFIIVGLFYIDHTYFFNIDQKKWIAEEFSAASLIVFYAFSGFESLPLAAAEMHNPKKNIPIAVFIVISICASLYFFIQLIAMGVLGSNLCTSQTPILDAAAVLFGNWGKFFVGIAMLISIGGINIAASFLTPQSGVALSEDHLIPISISKRNRHGSPIVAIIITTAATSMFVLVGTFTQLVAISIVCRFIQYIPTCIAVFIFHYKGCLNPFDKRWKIGIPLIALAGISWLLIEASVEQLLWGTGALVLGIPLYLSSKFRRTKEQGEQAYTSD